MRVKQEIINILEQCEIQQNRLYLPAVQLDRKLYVDVNKVLELAGGKWSKKEKAHVFNADIGDTLDTIILTGEIQDIKKELQYYPTPDAVVDQLFKLAKLSGNVDYLCLEPSAGEGAIARRLFYYDSTADVCEINPAFHGALEDLGCNVVADDFMQYNPEHTYNLIIANPPFTRQQDIDHVNHMLDLCPNGTVVSVMSAGVLFRQDRKTQAFRERVEERGGEFVELPEGSFKQSGTMVSTCAVVVKNNH